MRLALTALVTLAAALAAEVASGNAEESFSNRQFCTRSPTGAVALDCAYNSWAQCIEAVRGLGRYCTENPSWHGVREPPTTQGRSGRRSR
jgi:Protein of unknown function (DUF3551)